MINIIITMCSIFVAIYFTNLITKKKLYNNTLFFFNNLNDIEIQKSIEKIIDLVDFNIINNYGCGDIFDNMRNMRNYYINISNINKYDSDIKSLFEYCKKINSRLQATKNDYDNNIISESEFLSYFTPSGIDELDNTMILPDINSVLLEISEFNNLYFNRGNIILKNYNDNNNIIYIFMRKILHSVNEINEYHESIVVKNELSNINKTLLYKIKNYKYITVWNLLCTDILLLFYRYNIRKYFLMFLLCVI